MPPTPFRRAAVLLTTLVLAAGCSGGSGGSAAAPTAVPAPEKIPGVVIERAAGRSHRAGHIDYPGPMPPSGGDHAAIWLNCGFYSTPQPNENAVHVLEHGGVWIAYGPSATPADIATIRTLAKHDHVIATPVAGMHAPFELVAWERRLEVDAIGDARVVQFIDAFSSGAVAPEKGAPCTGGVGTPG